MEWLLTLILSSIFALFSSMYIYSLLHRGKAPSIRAPLGNLHIYVGTQSCAAMALAKRLSQQALSFQFKPHIIALEDFSIAEFKKHDYCVIVCSSLAAGKPSPDSLNFIKSLSNVAKLPNFGLSKVAYGVFGLCQCAEDMGKSAGTRYSALQVDEALSRANAKRLLEVGQAEEGESAAFEEWSREVWRVLPARAKASRHLKVPNFLEVIQHIPLDHQNPASGYSEITQQLLSSRNLYSDECKILKIKELQKDPEHSAMHIELGTDLPYEAAGNLSVFPENDDDLVREIAAIQDYDLEETFMFSSEIKQHAFPTPTTVGDALKKYCDVTSLIRKKTLKQLASFATATEDQRRLEFLASLKGKEEFRSVIEEPLLNLVNLFELFPSIRVPIGALVQVLDRIQPRFYSISSSPKKHPHSIHIVVKLSKTKTCEGQVKIGLCSGYLHKMFITELYSPIKAFLRPSIFTIPKEPVPLVMVAIGAAIAPFNAIIQEYMASATRPHGELTLIYGCRERNKQFVYKKEIEASLIRTTEFPEDYEYHPQLWSEGRQVLSKLYTAFSNESSVSVHVQDIILNCQEKIWYSLCSGGRMYICGSNALVKSVIELLETIAGETVADGDGKNAVAELVRKKQIAVEAWG